MAGLEKYNWDNLTSYIKESKRILLSTHINSDGDGLGSEVAFYYYLQDFEKDCRIINATSIPYNLKIIDPDSIVETYNDTMDDWLSAVDLTIVFDIGDYRRTGPIGDKVYKSSAVISIDHHPQKDGHPFVLNIVESDAPATTYMIWKYFEYLGKTSSHLNIKIAKRESFVVKWARLSYFRT